MTSADQYAGAGLAWFKLVLSLKQTFVVCDCSVSVFEAKVHCVRFEQVRENY